VIGIAHPKWEERPLLVIERHDGADVKADDVLAEMGRHVARWQLPDEVVFATIPLTATGKIDKKTLRRTYAGRYSSG